MKIEPESLNIPLNRRRHWGFVLVAVCLVVTAVSWFISTPFALAFAASTITALPVLLLALSSSRISHRISQAGSIGSIGVFAVLFGYIAFAKSVLVPIIVEAIERALV